MTLLVNRTPIIRFTFPGGEEHVRLSEVQIGAKTSVYASLKSSKDVMALLLTIDAIYRTRPDTQISLMIPYIPYARQDRVCNVGESLSIKVMARLINQLQCHEVVMVDPHSDVAPALIDKARVIHQADIIVNTEMAAFIRDNNCALIAPDAGSHKKCAEIQKKLLNRGIETELFTANKSRNLIDGKIIHSEVNGDVRGKNLLILDDICDGGRTFTALSQLLKDKGAKKIFLYVTHGIFSQGLEPLKKGFDQIFCYHKLNDQVEQNEDILHVLDTFADELV